MNNANGDRPGTHRRRRARSWPAWASDERGSATVMVALSATGIIALLALGIDLGALFNARSEAQRAADSAALAGASAFLEFQQENARSVALERALKFATSNEIRGSLIAPEDVTIAVNPDSSTVRATIRRNGVPTWFARVFGVESVAVAAEATAWAGAAGAAQCVKRFAIPDLWDEKTDDLNQNRIWDEGERWRYDPASGDRYERYSGPGGASTETGYGSRWRNGFADAHGRTYEGDYGRRITVKVTDPRETMVASFFLPWVLPPDPHQATCGSGQGGRRPGPGDGDDDGSVDPPEGGPGSGSGWGKWRDRRGGLGAPAPGQPSRPPGAGSGTSRDGGEGRGAAQYRQNICSCNASIIDLDTEYLIEPGNMVGPTYHGLQTLIEQDPKAYWDDRSNRLVSELGMDSPRVITVALFSPEELSKPGRQYIRFNNFARIFVEAQASPQDPVTGRLLYYVPGVGSAGRSGATTGSLVRTLQLIR
jgi:hypothetical protein